MALAEVAYDDLKARMEEAVKKEAAQVEELRREVRRLSVKKLRLSTMQDYRSSGH